MTDNNYEIACDINAMDEGQRARHQVLRAAIFPQMLGAEALADGYAFTFAADGDMLQRLAEYVMLESLCCPFFHFSLDYIPREQQLALRLTGGEHIRDFLQAELGSLLAG